MKNIKLEKYPAYKDSGENWLGQIPVHWELKKVKNVFRLVVEPAPKNNNFELLSVYTDIGVKPRRELEERGNKASNTDGYWFVKKGDIVVNKLLAWMGAIGVSNYNGVTSPAYDILRAKVKIESNYFHYLFRNDACISELRRNSRGIMDMRLRLYFDKFGDILIPFPNYYDQKLIVDFLDRKTALIDQSIDIKQKQIELLKERRQILIHNAVTRGINPNVKMKDSGVEWIGEIPEHWEVKRLKDVCFINLNSLPENTNSYFQFNYVDIGSVTLESGISNTEEYTFKNAPSRARRIAKTGDTIISTVRTYLKAIDFIDQFKSSYIYSTGFAVLQPKEFICPEFLGYFVRSDAFTEQVSVNSKGMSYPAINSTDIGTLAVVHCGTAEQQMIIKHIESNNTKIAKAISLILQEIEKLKEYKATLINSAVTGKIKVTNDAK